MTRSIFDPTGGETERSGSTHLGPTAGNLSHLPPDVTDGAASEEEAVDASDADRDDETPQTFPADSAEAARRLDEMTAEGSGADETLDEMPPPAPDA